MQTAIAKELDQEDHLRIRLMDPTAKYTHFENSIIPEIIYLNDKDKGTILTFNHDGMQYEFSNKSGHQVTYSGGYNSRPMTKKEFNQIRALMIEKTITHFKNSEDIIEEIAKLNYGEGHANKTFEVVSSPLGRSKTDVLTINLGNARYIYNQPANTVLHIDHSKRINGTMLQGEKKEEIIKKITSSKTMTKKIREVKQQTK